MAKLSFSGHETFSCKIYWPKKGYDFVRAEKKFTDDDAVVDLGVGKNMVTSIRFWLKAFGLIDDNDQTTQFADFIFGDNGVDPYLEDPLTLWLLHYQLIKTERASVYSLVYNLFRRERINFNKDHLVRFLNRVMLQNGQNFSANTLNSDIKVFISNYVSNSSSDVEDSNSNILQELGLIAHYKQRDDQDHLHDWYRFNMQVKHIPYQALLFVILDNGKYGNTVSLSQLSNDPSSVGNVFLLTENVLVQELKQLSQQYGIYTETAGNQVLQLNEGLDKFNILEEYYHGDYARI